MSTHYDLFLSYRTTNANLVRQVAECLIVNSLSIWFAEYEISFDIYEDDRSIDEAISRGITASTHAVVFTNNLWADSTYCNREMALILGHLPEQSIVEVRIPDEEGPRRRWPELNGIRSMESDHSLAPIIDFLNEQKWFGQPLLVPTTSESDLTDAAREHLRFGVSLARSPLHKRPLWRRPALIGMRGRVAGRDIESLVQVHYEETVLGELQVPEDADVDDRELYRRFRGFAHNFLTGERQTPVGIHLFFMGGHSHLALTSHQPAKQGRCDWERRYAILLRDRVAQELGEVDLAFSVSLPEDRKVGFREFCRLTPTFDAIAHSLQYQGRDPFLSRESLTQLAVDALFFLWAVRWLLHALQEPTPTAAAIWAGVSGVSAGALLTHLHSTRARREVEVTGARWGERLFHLLFPLAFARDLVNRVLGTGIGVLGQATAGMRNLLVIVGLAFGIYQHIWSPWYWGLFGVCLAVMGAYHQRLRSRKRQPWL